MAFEPKRITELYAWVCREPDGGDGIPAIGSPDLGGMLMPLVGSDRARMESLRPYAESVARERGYPTRLLRFHQVEELETL